MSTILLILTVVNLYFGITQERMINLVAAAICFTAYFVSIGEV